MKEVIIKELKKRKDEIYCADVTSESTLDDIYLLTEHSDFAFKRFIKEIERLNDASRCDIYLKGGILLEGNYDENLGQFKHRTYSDRDLDSSIRGGNLFQDLKVMILKELTNVKCVNINFDIKRDASTNPIIKNICLPLNYTEEQLNTFLSELDKRYRHNEFNIPAEDSVIWFNDDSWALCLSDWDMNYSWQCEHFWEMFYPIKSPALPDHLKVN